MKKEVRALLPLWAGAAAGLATVCLALPDWPTTARLLYGLSSIALSAMAIGHEYLYGTLPSFLSLPATRTRLLAIKLAAVVPMLLTLGLLAVLLLPPDPRFDWGTAAPALSLLCAVLIAPLLTMMCRSPLGGVVFAVGVIGGLQSLKGYGQTEALLAASAIGLVGGWRAFMRLEALGGGLGELSLPMWFRGSSNTTWLLIEKELRLQQMSFIVAAVHLVFSGAYTFTMARTPDVREVLSAIGIMYAVLLAILIGSLASAEERRMHTLEWQVLLPIAAWKQWIVKSAVTFGVAGFMCLVLPMALARDMAFSVWPIAAVVVLTAGSLYISSLNGSGLAALAWSAPVMLILMMATVSWLGPSMLGGALLAPRPGLAIFLVGLGVLLVGLALRFAYDNHRLGRDTNRVRWQLLSMAVIFAVFTAAA